MKVFVLTEVHLCPEVDGGNDILGVYSTREKAEKAREELKEGVDYFLDFGVSDTYDLTIDEFELDE